MMVRYVIIFMLLCKSKVKVGEHTARMKLRRDNIARE
jgi:hypothetical protein